MLRGSEVLVVGGICGWGLSPVKARRPTGAARTGPDLRRAKHRQPEDRNCEFVAHFVVLPFAVGYSRSAVTSTAFGRSDLNPVISTSRKAHKSCAGVQQSGVIGTAWGSAPQAVQLPLSS